MKTGPGEDRSPLHLLHRAGQRVDELFHAATHELDITPRQFLVLANIEKRGGLSRVQRRREERRTHLLCNTYNKRRAIMEQVKPIANEVNGSLLKCLFQHDARQLLRSLEHIVQIGRQHDNQRARREPSAT